MATIKFNQIVQKAAKSRAIVPKVEAQAREVFNPAKEALLNDFFNHPVTIEVNSGPAAENISETLGNRGSLYEYFGFTKESPSQIVGKLFNLIINRVKLQRITKVNKISRQSLEFQFAITTPKEDEIRAVTPVPWTEKSWAEAIETGEISNLNQFLSFRKIRNEELKESLAPLYEERSRSGTGLQFFIKPGGRSLVFKTRSYLTGIFEKFAARIHRKL